MNVTAKNAKKAQVAAEEFRVGNQSVRVEYATETAAFVSGLMESRNHVLGYLVWLRSEAEGNMPREMIDDDVLWCMGEIEKIDERLKPFELFAFESHRTSRSGSGPSDASRPKTEVGHVHEDEEGLETAERRAV